MNNQTNELRKTIGEIIFGVGEVPDAHNPQIEAIIALHNQEALRVSLETIGEDDKYLNGKMTNFKVDTRNQRNEELRQAFKEVYGDERL